MLDIFFLKCIGTKVKKLTFKYGGNGRAICIFQLKTLFGASLEKPGSSICILIYLIDIMDIVRSLIMICVAGQTSQRIPIDR